MEKIKKEITFVKQYNQLFNQELKLTESLILNLLTSYANANLKVIISNKGISDFFNGNIKKRCVSASVNRLKELGYITNSLCNQNYEESGKWFNQRTIIVTDKTFDLINGEPIKESVPVEAVASPLPEPIKEVVTAPKVEKVITPAEPVQAEPEPSESFNLKDILDSVIDDEEITKRYYKSLTNNGREKTEYSIADASKFIAAKKYSLSGFKDHRNPPSVFVKLAEDISELKSISPKPKLTVVKDEPTPEPTEEKSSPLNVDDIMKKYNQPKEETITPEAQAYLEMCAESKKFADEVNGM